MERPSREKQESYTIRDLLERSGQMQGRPITPYFIDFTTFKYLDTRAPYLNEIKASFRKR